MNNTNSHYDDKICEAIEYIVDNAVKQAEYDRTIQATIVRTVDQTIGKFSVKYQDSIFYAYGSPDTKYSNGAEVYVLIPGNDTSREKTILGSTKKLGTNYINNPEGEDAFEVIGMNVLKNSSEFGLCSYSGEYTQIIYNRENNINDIGLDIVATETYIKQSSTILCGANIRTALPIEQQIRGNYGIIFELAFSNSSGDINIKNYILDVNQMQGNPYRLATESRQFGIFEIDGENFQYVNKIYFFVSNFPNKAIDKPNDIFIKNLELSAVEKLSTEALNSYSLSFITPQGTYFDATHLDTETKSIQAQVRIKGKAIDKDSQKLDYYWFVENAAINYMNEKYNRYGGPGWECINTYTVIREAKDPEPAVIEWNPASYELIVTKTDIAGKERRYKCVAIYDDENIVSREITITNFSALYELSIESSEGTQFYFDIGSPTLTCKINGEERLEGYSYSWGRVDNTGTFTELVSTKENMTIENNKVNNFYVGDIINFAIIKCSVKYGDTYLGTAEITLLNSVEKSEDDEESGPDYSLVLHNGTQVFKYDETGLSPASGSLDEPQLILPLSFTVYNELGEKVSETELANATIQWIVPTENTMLKLTSVRDPDIINEDSVIYQNDFTANYLIRDEYDIGRSNNTITLIVQYDGDILTATTNFTFIKDGEPGTNGTEYICKIVPNVVIGDTPVYPTIMNGKLNYTPPMDEECWFKVQLWRNGINIFDSNTSDAEKGIEVQWSVLKNKYTRSISDVSAITVTNSAKGYFSYNGYQGAGKLVPANIIKCTVKYNDLYYYATLPLITGYTNDTNISLQVEDYTGFRYAIYTTDGIKPQYDDREPFKIRAVLEDGTDAYEYVSRTTQILGKIYNPESEAESEEDKWEDNLNIEEDSREEDSDLGWPRFQPKDQYSGECVTNAIEYTIDDPDGNEVGKVHIPIHLMLNRYGNSAFNDWDGNSISINNDGGFILAPQVGAGRKENDNSFTGILMGEVKEAGKSKVETGLFGYSSGQRSIFLNAEDGSAVFGTAGDESGGQIIIKPGAAPVIESNNFIYRDDIDNPGTGLQINFSSAPSIVFGSGNFEVDADGVIKSRAGFIGGFTIGKTALYNTTREPILTPTEDINTNGVYLGTDGIGLGTRSNYGTEDDPEYHRKFEVTSSGRLYTIRGRIGDFTLNDGVLYTENADIWPLDNFDPLDPDTYDNPINVRGIHLSSKGLSFHGAAKYFPTGETPAPPNGLYCGIDATDGTFYAQKARISPYWAYDDDGVRAYALSNGESYWKVDTEGSMQCGSIAFMADFPWIWDRDKDVIPYEVSGIIGPFYGTATKKVDGKNIDVDTVVLGMITDGLSIVLETDQATNANIRLTGDNIYLDSKRKIYYRSDESSDWKEFTGGGSSGGTATFG